MSSTQEVIRRLIGGKRTGEVPSPTAPSGNVFVSEDGRAARLDPLVMQELGRRDEVMARFYDTLWPSDLYYRLVEDVQASDPGGVADGILSGLQSIDRETINRALLESTEVRRRNMEQPQTPTPTGAPGGIPARDSTFTNLLGTFHSSEDLSRALGIPKIRVEKLISAGKISLEAAEDGKFSAWDTSRAGSLRRLKTERRR